MPPDHKIAKILSGHKPLRPKPAVAKLHNISVRNPKPPTDFLPGEIKLRRRLVPACPRINRLLFSGVRRCQGPQHILSRAGAGINQALGAELLKRGAINSHSFTLRIRPKRPAHIRALLPFKPKPMEILNRGGNKLGFASGEIQIIHSQHDHAVAFAGALLGHPKCPRMAQMQIARGRRRDASAINVMACAHRRKQYHISGA